MLLAIDPGVSTGWALFNNAFRLHSCGLGMPTVSDAPDEVVIECEQLRGRSEKNPNSILLMARNAGEWFGRFAARGAYTQYIRVADWKGATPKDINHRRTFSKLGPDELAALVSGCSGVSPRSASVDAAIRVGLTKADKRGNILDAVGIGLWAVGR